MGVKYYVENVSVRVDRFEFSIIYNPIGTPLAVTVMASCLFHRVASYLILQPSNRPIENSYTTRPLLGDHFEESLYLLELITERNYL